jgi:putative intracellular protease/amidase
MATLLMPLPDSDFDPTESGVPWCTMRDHGHNVVFATPTGRTALADPKMVTGEGLGILSPLLKADANGRSAYLKMEQSDAFRRPISYGEIRAVDFDALLLTGGHAPGMRVYLGSGVLQSAVGDFFVQEKPVGAICHGVLLAARSSLHSGKSVLYGKKTTALTKQMELIAWRLTRLYLGDYYRTYPMTVEDEVRSVLARPEDFISGPLPVRRDSAARLGVGFTVRDGDYLSARWPGDAHRFASEFATMIG